jgi:hypothetical protein
MVIVGKCGVERILHVSDIDVKLLLLNMYIYRRALKERAVLESSSQPSCLEMLFL